MAFQGYDRKVSARPSGRVSPSGLEAVARSWNDAARSFDQLSGEMFAKLEEQRSMAREAEVNRIQTDAIVLANELAQKHANKPEEFLSEGTAWLDTRIKEFGKTLGESDQKYLPGYHEKLRSIFVRGSLVQANGAYQVQKEKLVSGWGKDVDVLRADMERRMSDTAKIGVEMTGEMVRGMFSQEFADLLASGEKMVLNGTMKQAALDELIVKGPKALYQSYVAEKAADIARTQGVDAANAYILDPKHQKEMGYSAQELEVLESAAADRANETMMPDQNARKLALDGNVAELAAAKTTQEVMAVQPAANLSADDLRMFVAKQRQRLLSVQNIEEDNGDAMLVDSVTTQVQMAVDSRDPSVLSGIEDQIKMIADPVKRAQAMNDVRFGRQRISTIKKNDEEIANKKLLDEQAKLEADKFVTAQRLLMDNGDEHISLDDLYQMREDRVYGAKTGTYLKPLETLLLKKAETIQSASRGVEFLQNAKEGTVANEYETKDVNASISLAMKRGKLNIFEQAGQQYVLEAIRFTKTIPSQIQKIIDAPEALSAEQARQFLPFIRKVQARGVSGQFFEKWGVIDAMNRRGESQESISKRLRAMTGAMKPEERQMRLEGLHAATADANAESAIRSYVTELAEDDSWSSNIWRALPFTSKQRKQNAHAVDNVGFWFDADDVQENMTISPEVRLQLRDTAISQALTSTEFLTAEESVRGALLNNGRYYGISRLTKRDGTDYSLGFNPPEMAYPETRDKQAEILAMHAHNFLKSTPEKFGFMGSPDVNDLLDMVEEGKVWVKPTYQVDGKQHYAIMIRGPEGNIEQLQGQRADGVIEGITFDRKKNYAKAAEAFQ